MKKFIKSVDLVLLIISIFIPCVNVFAKDSEYISIDELIEGLSYYDK